jgi:hypothetical protein
VYRLKGKPKGALLKERVWFEGGKVFGFSLAYINLKRCPVDHGRVLGIDNSQEYYHRHFMGQVEPINFTSHEALVDRIYSEVRELWKIEEEGG